MKVAKNQNIFDVALQKTGSVSAAFDLAVLNGLSVTDDLTPGTELKLLDVTNKDIVDYYKNRGLVPATRIEDFELDRVFGNEFAFEFS